MKGWSQEPGIRRLLAELSRAHGADMEVLESDVVDGVAARRPGIDGHPIPGPEGDSGWVIPQTGGPGTVAGPRVLQHAASILGTYLASLGEIDSLSSEIADRYEELNLLYNLGESLGALKDEREICARVLAEARRIVGGERGSILLHDGGGSLRIAASFNLPEGVDADAPIPAEGSICGWTFRAGRGVLADAADGIPVEALPPGGGRPADAGLLLPPLLSVPLKYKEETLGTLAVCAKAFGRAFTAHDLKLAQAIAAQAAIFLALSRFIEDVRASEQIRRELEIAHEIQQGLLPRREPEIPGVEVAGQCRPASAVGGDYYGFFEEVVPGMTGVTILDVAGHSVGAAVGMAAVRSILRCEAWSRRSPREVIERVNDVLCADLEEGGMYATLVYLLYDHRSGDLRYTNAGHPPPLLLRSNEQRCRRLGLGGMGVGISRRQPYREERVQLTAGDLLLLYTDGMVEARDRAGEPFGEARLGQLVGKYRGATAWEVVSALMGELESFTGGAPPGDDVALVAMRAVPSVRRTAWTPS